MGYKFVTVNGRKNLRMTEIICDTENDLVDIPVEKLEMGSTVYVIATGETQTLASDGTWTVEGNADDNADKIAALEAEIETARAGSATLGAEVANKANKSQGTWTKLTLTNGWTGDLYYRKNQLGEMEFYGNALVAGTAALNTIIAATPTGSRVLANMLPMATYDTVTGNVLHINARSNGNVVLGNGFTTGRTYHLAGSYATA